MNFLEVNLLGFYEHKLIAFLSISLGKKTGFAEGDAFDTVFKIWIAYFVVVVSREWCFKEDIYRS